MSVIMSYFIYVNQFLIFSGAVWMSILILMIFSGTETNEFRYA